MKFVGNQTFVFDVCGIKDMEEELKMKFTSLIICVQRRERKRNTRYVIRVYSTHSCADGEINEDDEE